MKTASLVFLAAAALAGTLLLGRVSLGASVPSPRPIALHGSRLVLGGGHQAGSGQASGARSSEPTAARTEIAPRVEQTSLSAYARRRPG